MVWLNNTAHFLDLRTSLAYFFRTCIVALFGSLIKYKCHTQRTKVQRIQDDWYPTLLMKSKGILGEGA